MDDMQLLPTAAVSSLADIIRADIWGIATPESIAYLHEHLTFKQWADEVSKLFKIALYESQQLIAQKQRMREHFTTINTEASKDAYLRFKERLDPEINQRRDFIALCHVKQQQLKDEAARQQELKQTSAVERKKEKRAEADERRFQFRRGYDSGFYAAAFAINKLIESGMSPAQALDMCVEQQKHLDEWRNRNIADEPVPWLPDFPKPSADKKA